MSGANEEKSAALSETLQALANGLTAIARQVEPILSELAKQIEPLTRYLTTAAPHMLAMARGMERWDTAESLLKRGWVPNLTTPFDLVTACGDDDAKLQAELLAFYTDNWGEVRTQLEARLSSHDIDDEARAVFREALDAHEAGLYRSVSRLLFPEFERVFRAALFDGRAGPIPYDKFLTKLTGEEVGLDLGDFLLAGIQDMVLFNYLTESARGAATSGHRFPQRRTRVCARTRRRNLRNQCRARAAEPDTHTSRCRARPGSLFVETEQPECSFHC